MLHTLILISDSTPTCFVHLSSFELKIVHMLLMFQCDVVVTINTVAVSIIFERVVNIASKTIVLDIDVEVENFTFLNIVLTTIAAVSVIVAHRSKDYDRLSVFLSLFLSPV